MARKKLNRLAEKGRQELSNAGVIDDRFTNGMRGVVEKDKRALKKWQEKMK